LLNSAEAAYRGSGKRHYAAGCGSDTYGGCWGRCSEPVRTAAGEGSLRAPASVSCHQRGEGHTRTLAGAGVTGREKTHVSASVAHTPAQAAPAAVPQKPAWDGTRQVRRPRHNACTRATLSGAWQAAWAAKAPQWPVGVPQEANSTAVMTPPSSPQSKTASATNGAPGRAADLERVSTVARPGQTNQCVCVAQGVRKMRVRRLAHGAPESQRNETSGLGAWHRPTCPPATCCTGCLHAADTPAGRDRKQA